MVVLPNCPGVGMGPLALGQACTSNAECNSALCTLFSDAPLDPAASCEVPEADCSMRITGNIRDIVTGAPIVGADMIAAAALQAVTNPGGAQPLASAVSVADGHVDAVTMGPPAVPIGLYALSSLGGYWLTGTELALPIDNMTTYGVANDVHDLWLVPEADATAWSTELALDPAIDPTSLPLGDMGGVVGLARDGVGLPLPGVTVGSTNGASTAVIRYLNLDGTFNASATTDAGLFVIIEPALAETFEGSLGAMVFDSGAPLSANGALFTLVLTAP